MKAHKSFFFPDLVLFYYSGLLVKFPKNEMNALKNGGFILERASLTYDLALQMKNGSTYPLSKLQTTLASLKSKRKLLILDGRIFCDAEKELPFMVLPEEIIDNLSTVLTIYSQYEIMNGLFNGKFMIYFQN